MAKNPKVGQVYYHLRDKTTWELRSIRKTTKGSLFSLYNKGTKEYKSYYSDKLETLCLPVTNKKMIKLLYKD